MTPPENVTWHSTSVPRAERWKRLGLHGGTVWLTGLSGSGKSTVANALAELLHEAGIAHTVLDGDNLRHGLTADLGFTEADRAENVQRVGEVARLMADAGLVAIVPVISPYRADRDRVRAAHVAADLTFLEVFVDTALAVCAERDPKGLYVKALVGEITGLTGVDAPYEAPLHPEVRVTPSDGAPREQAACVFDALIERRGQPASPTG